MAFSGSGSGTSGDPYIITTLSELNEIQDDLTAYYELANDIDASDTVNWNGGAGWVPIGSFGGSLDGKGYTISELYINRPSTDEVGLFGYIGNFSGDMLQNFNLTDVDITGQDRVGGVIGRGVITTSLTKNISSITVTGEVTGRLYVGGFVGWTGILSGDVPAKNYFYDCGATVTVTGTTYVGGFVGYSSLSGSSGRDIYYEGCYAKGVVSGDDNVGGFVGFSGCDVNAGLGNHYTDCYAQGNVSATASAGNNAGGFFGYHRRAYDIRCYSTGVVSGHADYIGGFVGYWDNNTNRFEDCFWDETKNSGLTDRAGGSITNVEGKTTSEMQQQSTFTNYDFDTVWIIKEGEDYAELRWAFTPGPIPANYTLDIQQKFALKHLDEGKNLTIGETTIQRHVKRTLTVRKSDQTVHTDNTLEVVR